MVIMCCLNSECLCNHVHNNGIIYNAYNETYIIHASKLVMYVFVFLMHVCQIQKNHS